MDDDKPVIEQMTDAVASAATATTEAARTVVKKAKKAAKKVAKKVAPKKKKKAKKAAKKGPKKAAKKYSARKTKKTKKTAKKAGRKLQRKLARRRRPRSRSAEHLHASSRRTPGPITTGLSFWIQSRRPARQTIAAAAYGSRIGARCARLSGTTWIFANSIFKEPLHSSSPGLPPSLKLRRASTAEPRRSLLTAEVRLRTKAVGVAGTGRSSIPETSAIEPRSRGVLDAPLEAGHDSGERRAHRLLAA